MSDITLSVDLVAASRRSEALSAIPIDLIQQHVADYLRFLTIVLRHGGPVAPTREIDQIWHLHMLHPVAYQEDCMRLFGRILDHDGGFGSIPEERPLLGRVFERTAALWEAEFDEPYVKGQDGSMEKCWHDCAGRCHHACKSVDNVLTG